MKKIISLLLSIVMIASAFFCVDLSALAANTGNCGDSISYTISESGELTFSGYGAMADYECDESPFSNRSDIKKIVISEGITSIGDYVFSYCTGFDSITIPNTVVQIGERSFENCESLTTITIPDSVTSIGESCFKSCISLQSIIFPPLHCYD